MREMMAMTQIGVQMIIIRKKVNTINTILYHKYNFVFTRKNGDTIHSINTILYHKYNFVF